MQCRGVRRGGGGGPLSVDLAPETHSLAAPAAACAMAEDAKKSQRQKELEEKRKKLEAIRAQAKEPPAPAPASKPAATAAPAPAPTAPDLKKVDNVEDLLRGLDAIPCVPMSLSAASLPHE